MGGGEIATGVGRSVEAGPGCFKGVGVQEERVDAGARLNVVEKSRDAILQQVRNSA